MVCAGEGLREGESGGDGEFDVDGVRYLRMSALELGCVRYVVCWTVWWLDGAYVR